jgi:hypothetical protein
MNPRLLNDDPRVKEALALENLEIAPSLPVTQVQAYNYEDSQGYDALWVNITLADSFRIEKTSADDTFRLRESMYQNLLARGVDLFPYTFLRTESELAEMQ